MRAHHVLSYHVVQGGLGPVLAGGGSYISPYTMMPGTGLPVDSNQPATTNTDQ